MLIEKNTVSAENQMVNSSEVSFLGNKNAKLKILVLGNSITRHGPCVEIGWEGDWGMAASAPEKDYVHRLYAMLTESGQDIFMRIHQCAFWERNFLKEDILSYYEEEKAFEADIIIFRLGENVAQEDKFYFKEALEKFITYLRPNGGKVIFTTCFWPNTIIDQAIEEFAKEQKEICINCAFSADEKNMALGQFAHEGVAMHPSDSGMEKIAKAIFKVL